MGNDGVHSLTNVAQASPCKVGCAARTSARRAPASAYPGRYSICCERASGLVTLKGVRTPPYMMRACSMSSSRRSWCLRRSSLTPSTRCSGVSCFVGCERPASTSVADSRRMSEPYCWRPLSSDGAPALLTWALTSAALNCITSRAPIAVSLVWSDPNMAMATSGSIAPACTIIRLHTSDSARVPIAAAADVCSASYTPISRALPLAGLPPLSIRTRSGTAPAWQMAAWWPLSSAVVGSSSASACSAPAQMYCACSSPSRMRLTRRGTTPAFIAAFRNVVG
mmetsp:Transcript_29254/g.85779  ORF Transcript_29254/g.85779 Transcript_29254/m.85779 type:complete len:281 (-) Transcript_29254:83-925(-)